MSLKLALATTAITYFSWLFVRNTRRSKAHQKGESRIPILDFNLFKSSKKESRERFIAELRDACHNVGFFYLANHSVSRKLSQEVFSQAWKFFQRPVEEKVLIENLNSPHFRGYSKVDSELTRGKKDYREQIEIGVNQPPLELKRDAPKYLRLVGPNQYPDAEKFPGFKDAIEQFMREVIQLGDEIMVALALSLDLPADQFSGDFADPYVRMKLLHYPPQPIEEQRIGVGPHRDYGWLTFLVQDEVGGLQVQNNHGEWVDAIPIADTFIVNLGEMLQIVTDNYFLATPHQVINKSSSQGRISIPVFYNPHLNTEVKPLQLADKFKRSSVPPMQSMVFGVNVLKGLARTHPEVVRRHHPDLTPSDVSRAISEYA